MTYTADGDDLDPEALHEPTAVADYTTTLVAELVMVLGKRGLIDPVEFGQRLIRRADNAGANIEHEATRVLLRQLGEAFVDLPGSDQSGEA